MDPGGGGGQHNGLGGGMASSSSQQQHDGRTLEIRTRSIEATLVPLVNQITALVNFKDEALEANGHGGAAGRRRPTRQFRIALKVSASVETAVERFVAVGETIADENPDVQPELYDACHEARQAGAAIARLSSLEAAAVNDENGDPDELSGLDWASERQHLVRACRQLLSSVTRVLLLADRVIVKQILRAADKVSYSLTKLENTTSFTDFVKIFTEFGGEMVELAHRTGERQHDLKSSKRSAQMASGRAALERLTMLLLTSSKALLRHPDCESALRARDAVFAQIRLALQLVALCASDGVLPLDVAMTRFVGNAQLDLQRLDVSLQLTAHHAIRQLCEVVDMVSLTGAVGGAAARERLASAAVDMHQTVADFAHSTVTPSTERERILDVLDECKFEIAHLGPQAQQQPSDFLVGGGGGSSDALDVSVERLTRRLKELRRHLQVVALQLVSAVLRANEDQVLLSSIKACALAGDVDGVETYLDKLRAHCEHVHEVARLLHHVACTDALHVGTGECERALRWLAPVLQLAGRTLVVHASSRIARENLEVFCDNWGQTVNDLSRLAKEVDAAVVGRLAAEKQAYMSLPRPGKHGSTQKPTKPLVVDKQEQTRMAKVGLEMKLLTSEVDAEAEKWDEYAENDIVKRAKAMSSMAYAMYLFTRSDGPLRTTHDLFTQGEFFAEQANRMYACAREFSYEVPGSAEKSELLAVLERIPMHCQQLQVLVKQPTVGKPATFAKVDLVIQETKELMNEIAKLVTACFVCATKFEIEFRGGVAGGARGSGAIGDDGSVTGGGGGSGRVSRESSLWRRTPSMRRPASSAPPPI